MVTPVLETYSVVEDTAVTLECQATGTPEPQIRWYFGDLQLASSSHQYHILYNGGLQIPIVRREDTGSFTCVASNPAGEDSGLRFLEVTGGFPPVMLFLRCIYLFIQVCNNRSQRYVWESSRIDIV